MDLTLTLSSAPPPNPLDLPEILTRVGQFLPLWTGEGYNREFHPLPLLRCSLVSRTWRETLLPILWFVYDGFRIRNVPAQVLAKYSHLFRIISNTGSFKGPFHCRNLIELFTVYGQEWSRELLVKNPGLKRLVWGGPYHCRIETLEQQQELELELKALMGLENLDALKTFGFSLGEGLFVKMLRNNANRLSNLALSTVEGVTSIEGLELPFLTELHIAFGGTESPALVDLVCCCPRLQRLSLTGSKSNALPLGSIITNIDTTIANSVQKGFQIEKLAHNLAQCCPELSAIKFTSNNTSTTQSRCFLDDSQCATLVNASRRLESFSVDMVALDFTLTEALIGQRQSLKTLTLSFHNSDVEVQQAKIDHLREIHCVRRLKASLVRLTELTLAWDRDYLAPSALAAMADNNSTQSAFGFQEEITAFLDDPWGCLDLRTLNLNGIPVSVPIANVPSTSSAHPSETLLSSTTAGWRGIKLSTDINTDINATEAEMAQNLLLLNVAPLTKLRSLNLNQATYERT
ncbi:hypothetical protein BGZ65_001341 [Modicella reniformis]|uniref:Uncharacterized protein n=1 Tax=Modicella reniformis TaxID=1440133 RepID=A0A9P6J224_9FUNG|nr:hypothetical protein BGZ65_001341 [Modicella reniformis]